MLVLGEKTNYISIWIFITNVMKGVSLSTHLKVVVFYMNPSNELQLSVDPALVCTHP